jgi:hypothetical protein
MIWQRKLIYLASLFTGRNNTGLSCCIYRALCTVYYLDQQINNILTVFPNLLTYLLTPWSRVLLEKRTVNFAASQEIHRIYGTPKSPIGRRNHGRPLKRLLDAWDRNGSTSGPTPWQIYDDDDIFTLQYLFLRGWKEQELQSHLAKVQHRY